MHIMIITPIFIPSTGGAATYYYLLVSSLINKGLVSKVTVITEKNSDTHQCCDITNNIPFDIVRLFPYRAGGSFSKFSQYTLYAIQNVLYFRLLGMVKTKQPDLILVHSSFHNFPNVFNLIIRIISKNIPVIADVRDHQMPVKYLRQLDCYSAVIGCSLNVMEHIINNKSIIGRTFYIPVLQEKLTIRHSQSHFRINGNEYKFDNYIMYAGLIKENKGIPLLIETYAYLKDLGYSGKLVLVGVSKDNVLLRSALKLEGIVYLGAVPRDDVLDLIAGASLIVNLSKSEGLPRICLEALALGGKVLLPKGIPEFEISCPENVVMSINPEKIAQQIIKIMDSPLNSSYPISNHYPESVINKYVQIFNGLVSRER